MQEQEFPKCLTSGKWGRKLSWLSRDLLLELRWIREVYWKQGQVTHEDYKDAVHHCVDKAWLEFKLVSTVKDNKKERKIRDSIGLLLDEISYLTNGDIDKTETFNASVINTDVGPWAPQSPVLENHTGRMINSQPTLNLCGICCSISRSLFGPMGFIPGYWKSWSILSWDTKTQKNTEKPTKKKQARPTETARSLVRDTSRMCPVELPPEEMTLPLALPPTPLGNPGSVPIHRDSSGAREDRGWGGDRRHPWAQSKTN